MRAPNYFGADPVFGRTLASFLRRNGSLWRVRRIDRFEPQTLTLAHHEVSLQGRVGPAVLNRFFEVNPLPGIRRPNNVAGDELTLYVPFTREPKRLLTTYSLTHDGGPAPLLNRYEGTLVEALTLLSYIREGQRSLSEDETVALYLVLAGLAFMSPQTLNTRLSSWQTEGQPKPKRRLHRHRESPPLTDNDLLAWIESEGEFFLKDLGEPLRKSLETRVGRRSMSTVLISPASLGLGSHYRSLQGLLLFAIRDLLKVTWEFLPAWQGEGGNDSPVTRESFVDDPDGFVDFLTRNVLPGFDVLEELLRRPNWRPQAAGELMQDILGWWSYVVVTIRLGVPFVLKSAETMPAAADLRWRRPFRSVEGWWRSSMDTYQLYPLSLKDAESVHVELQIPQTELRIPGGWPPRSLRLPQRMIRGIRRALARLVRGKGPSLPEHLGLVRKAGRQVAPVDMDLAFSSVEAPSERLAHLYTSRMPHEKSAANPQLPFLKLYVPLRLSRQLALGYWAATVAYAIAASFVGFELFWYAATGDQLDLFAQALTVGVVVTPLALWMAQVQHRETIVSEKLAVFRNGLTFTMGIVFLAAIAAGVQALIELSESRNPPDFFVRLGKALTTITQQVAQALEELGH
jgi:hypothetical protein